MGARIITEAAGASDPDAGLTVLNEPSAPAPQTIELPSAAEVPQRSEGMRRAFVRGTIWTVASLCGSTLINVIVTAVLARRIVPEEFGLIAVVAAMTIFFGLLADNAIASAIVQNESLGRAELSSIFWFALCGSTVAYLLLATFAAPLARALEIPAMATVLPLLAANVVFYAAGIVPIAVLRRRLRFRELAASQVIATVAAAVIAVTMALAGFGYWALVAQNLAFVIVRNGAALAWSGWWPQMTLRIGDVRRITRFSGWMLGTVTLNYWSRNADTLLVAHLLGLNAAGFYNLAQRLVGPPMQLVIGGIRPLLHPVFVRISDETRRMRTAYLNVLEVSAIVTFAIAAVLWVTARPLVVALWGASWEPSAAIVRALAVLAAVQPINAFSATILMARNAMGRVLQLTILSSAAVVAGMLGGARFGGAGVAWGYSLTYLLVVFPACTWAVHRTLGMGLRDITGAFLVPGMAGAAVLGVGTAMTSVLAGAPDLLQLAVTAAASLSAGFVVVRLTAWPLVSGLVERRT